MPTFGGSTKDLQLGAPASGGESKLLEVAALQAVVAPRGSKLKMSIEKKIENIWLESRELGWTYNDFVSHLLEVLVVLNHRTFVPKMESSEGFNKATAP